MLTYYKCPIFQITKWYRNDWWHSANLVATDYILGNNLVEESILANRKRKRCRTEFRWSHEAE